MRKEVTDALFELHYGVSSEPSHPTHGRFRGIHARTFRQYSS